MKKGNEKFVGAAISRPHFEEIAENNKGITLIALIITIIVMLILVGVTVNIALNGGLFDTTKQAASGMNKAQIEERAYMIKMTLMADMEAKDDIIVATQEFKNRLVSELGGEIQGNKVIVADGKYDIIVKNTDLDVEVVEHNDYVNINSIITPKISYETITEEDIVIGANFNLDIELNLSSSDYVSLRKQEVADKTTYEEKKSVVLEYVSNYTNTEITSIDDYFLLTINSMLTEYGLNTHETLEECLVDENVRAKVGVSENEELTKGQIYNYFINGDISQELTEQQVVETAYSSITEGEINTNEYKYATKNLTIVLKKDGTEIDTNTVTSLVEGNEYSFKIMTENGVYEVLIINKTTGEEILIQEEKIVVNNMRDSENAISTEEATGIWTTDGSGTITKYSGTETDVIIPKYIGTEKITSIGNSAFQRYTNLTSITIPNSVTSIGNYAFSGCTSLTEITIPNSVATIGNGVFNGCTSLTNITIPSSVISIAYNAFSGCTSLTNITIPNSVATIGDYAFSGCTSLREIIIPNSVTSIGNYAFSGCTSLTEITIPNSVTTIGNGVFNGCTSLTEITIPNSVTSIGDYAFNGCTNLNSVTIPETVTSLGTKAFYNCSNISEITILGAVNQIGLYTFSGCTSLKKVSLAEGPYRIMKYAFSGCTSLTEIVIPNSVLMIQKYAFEGCTNLKQVTLSNSIYSIENFAFNGCESLEELTLPNTLTSIASSAFSYSGLKNIYFIKGTNSKPSGEPWGADGATVTEIDPPATEE